MRKAFTLIELTVAVALLAMMISFASLIFDMSIDTYRTAIASAEIMQKLQAITGQLNADFKGMKISPMGKVSFVTVGQMRSDSIAFFANGDFQSTGQYDKSGVEKTVAGNVAIIYYGLADVNVTEPREKVLVRRQTILTSDADFDPCDLQYGVGEYWNGDNGMSLSELMANITDGTFTVDELFNKLLTEQEDITSQHGMVTYMAEGVDDFTIQYVGGEDPDQGKQFNEWRPEDSEVIGWSEQLYPSALKFSFTLYDSKGVLKEGKTFTHIVYLE